MKKSISLVSIILFLSIVSFAQIRKIPAVVTDAFSKQYPTAQEVEYRDLLTSVQVHFVSGSAKMIAKYNNKGEWKETEQEWSYVKLTQDVKDGFQKSKYSDEWKVTETALIYLSDGSQRYRLKVEKNDVQKKYLYFDKNGRLLRDSLTV